MGGFISAHFFYVRGLIFCKFFLNLDMREINPSGTVLCQNSGRILLLEDGSSYRVNEATVPQIGRMNQTPKEAVSARFVLEMKIKPLLKFWPFVR